MLVVSELQELKEKVKPMAHQFQNLLVWQKAVSLSGVCFRITKKFPSAERYGLSSQVTSASVSIAANIAEGAGRNSKKEFEYFLGIARGSGYELLTLLQIAFEAGMMEEVQFHSAKSDIDEILKMIFGLQESLKNEWLLITNI